MAKDTHVGTRVSKATHAQLDLIKDLRGLPSVAALLNEYIEAGLKLDSVDIEAKIEARLAAERDRLMAQVRGVGQVADDDEDDDEPDMFEGQDEDEPVSGTVPPRVAGPADASDLIPS